MTAASIIAKINSASAEKKKELMDKIKKNGADYGIYPVANEQKRMLFLNEALEDPCIYNSRFIIKMTSAEEIAMLRKALEHIVHKHESLRMMYFRIDGTYFQTPCDHDEAEIPYDEIDLSEEYSDDENEFIECINDMTYLPFDHAREIPVRCLSVKARSDLYFMVITFHHIAIDGWSMGIIQNELNDYMKLAACGSEMHDEEPDYQYTDYALWQQTDDYRDLLDECRNFWISYLKNSEKQLKLPYEKDCDGNSDMDCDYYDCFIPDELDEQVRKWLKDTRKSMFNFMLSVFYIALFSFTEQDNINIGTPSANRNREEYGGIVGFFANTVVINAVKDTELSFRQFSDEIEKNTYDVFQNQDFPIDMIVAEVCTDRTSFENALFQVMYSVQNESLINKGIKTEKRDAVTIEQFGQQSRTQFPLIFTVIDRDEKTQLALSYWNKKFSKRRIKALSDTMIKLIEQVMEDDSKKLKELSLKDITEDIAKYGKSDGQHTEQEVFSKKVTPEIIEKVIDIWKSVTGCDQIDKDSKFFQIGGNSMNAVIVMQMISEEFDIDIKIDDLFKYTTVSSLASFICSQTHSSEAENDDVIFASF